MIPRVSPGSIQGQFDGSVLNWAGALYFLGGATGWLASLHVGRWSIAGGLSPIIILMFAQCPLLGFLGSGTDKPVNLWQVGIERGKYAISMPAPGNDSIISLAANCSSRVAPGELITLTPNAGVSVPQLVPQYPLVSMPALSKTNISNFANVIASNRVHSSPSKTKRSACKPLNLDSRARRSACCLSERVLRPSEPWSSRRLRSAVAARSCCRAISALASDAFCSNPTTRASAFAARSCCFARDDLADVRSLSKVRSFSSWRRLMMLPVMRTPAPAAKVRKSSTTAAPSNMDFSASIDIENVLIAALGALAVLCAIAFPFVYRKYCNTKRVDRP